MFPEPGILPHLAARLLWRALFTGVAVVVVAAVGWVARGAFGGQP